MEDGTKATEEERALVEAQDATDRPDVAPVEEVVADGDGQ